MWTILKQWSASLDSNETVIQNAVAGHPAELCWKPHPAVVSSTAEGRATPLPRSVKALKQRRRG